MVKKRLFLVCLIGTFLLFSNKIQSQEVQSNQRVFCHTLFYKFSTSITENDKAEFLELFKSLPKKVDGLEQVNISSIESSSEEFDIIIVLSFNAEEGLIMYQNHPDHDKINDLASRLISAYSYYRYWTNQ